MTTVVKTEVVGNEFQLTLSDGSVNEFHLGRDVSQMIGAWCASHGVEPKNWLPAMEEFKALKDAFFQ